MPRLRRGVYLIGLAPEAWRSGMELGELAGGGAGRAPLAPPLDRFGAARRVTLGGVPPPGLSLRPVRDDDRDFLYRVYA